MKKRIIDLMASVALILYPVAIFVGIQTQSLRWATLIILVVLAPALYLRLRHRSARELTAFAWIPLMTIALLTASAVLNNKGYILLAPVIANLVLLIGFGTTLWTGMPMIERFARLQDKELSDKKVRWCKLWTWIWCIFFVINGTIAAVLALQSLDKWWALYNSLIAYLLIGTLFGVERSLRWYRFERHTATSRS